MNWRFWLLAAAGLTLSPAFAAVSMDWNAHWHRHQVKTVDLRHHWEYYDVCRVRIGPPSDDRFLHVQWMADADSRALSRDTFVMLNAAVRAQVIDGFRAALNRLDGLQRARLDCLPKQRTLDAHATIRIEYGKDGASIRHGVGRGWMKSVDLTWAELFGGRGANIARPVETVPSELELALTTLETLLQLATRPSECAEMVQAMRAVTAQSGSPKVALDAHVNQLDRNAAFAYPAFYGVQERYWRAIQPLVLAIFRCRKEPGLMEAAGL